MPTPAESLLGHKLDDGWTVVEKLSKSRLGTGGHNSSGYIVEKDGTKAFLKAIDYVRAFRSKGDTAREIEYLVKAFNFERDLCYQCKNSRLDRVIHPLADGKIYIDPDNPFSQVQYIIFELAECDVRTRLKSLEGFDRAFILRTLHHIANGLRQLHKNGVAHQDMKPSNVLTFDKGKPSKVGDLGCASTKEGAAPRDSLDVAGDTTYAPPELLYGFTSEDWTVRRVGCDAYHLGSLVVFFFTEVGMTQLLLNELDAAFLPANYGGTFEDLKPYLQDAFEHALQEFSTTVPEPLQQELTLVVRELCNPDPQKRGDTKNIASSQNRFELERYISRFDRLASKAERELLTSSKEKK